MSAPEAVDTVLLAWYERYIGEPETKSDVYLGFGLFFGGIAIGAIGLLAFLWSTGTEAGTDLFWTLRQLAVVLAALGLPAVMVGIVTLLPVSDRARYAAIAGAIICLLAMAVFAVAYPSNWNVRQGADYSAYGIGLYAIGVATVTAATGAALVGHQLERLQAIQPTDGIPDGRETTGQAAPAESGSTVTAEQVERDIEEAMRDVEYSWGGVRKVRTTELQVEMGDDSIDRSGFDDVATTTTRSADTGVDEAVAGLQQLRGGTRNESTGEGVDNQAAALSELREKKRAEELATDDRTVVRKLSDQLTSLFGK